MKHKRYFCAESVSQAGQQKRRATILLGLVISRENVSENMGTGFSSFKILREPEVHKDQTKYCIYSNKRPTLN